MAVETGMIDPLGLSPDGDGIPISRVLFFESDEACAVSYADRQGKYQGQRGIVLPTV
jgi:deoxycytidine triphosphate deaminase